MNNLVARKEIANISHRLKVTGRKVVFTNGCFDILHSGHVDYLSKAKKLGDILIVGLNSDISVKIIKGDKRPIINQEDRAILVGSLKSVDYVVFFDEPTPYELINEIVPDVLVKGGDWDIENIVGREVVEKNGGEVKSIKFINDQSTSKIIKIILERYKD